MKGWIHLHDCRSWKEPRVEKNPLIYPFSLKKTTAWMLDHTHRGIDLKNGLWIVYYRVSASVLVTSQIVTDLVSPALKIVLCHQSGDIRSWESLQTLWAPFNGPFEYVKHLRNWTLTIWWPNDRLNHSNVLSSSKSTTASYLAFKQTLKNNQSAYSNWTFYTEKDCDWLRRAPGDSQESHKMW